MIRQSVPFVATLRPASTRRADYCFDQRASTNAASTRCAFVANCASLPIPVDRPAIFECGCAALADASVLSVPAPERNQGSGLGGRGDGCHESSAGLVAGETRVSADLGRETSRRAKAGPAIHRAGALARTRRRRKAGVRTDRHDDRRGNEASGLAVGEYEVPVDESRDTCSIANAVIGSSVWMLLEAFQNGRLGWLARAPALWHRANARRFRDQPFRTFPPRFAAPARHGR